MLASLTHLAATLAVAGAWQGLLLLAAVALALHLLPSTSAALRSAVWAAAFALSVVLPLCHGLSAPLHPAAAGSPALHLRTSWELPLAAAWLALLLARATRLAADSLRLHRTLRASTPVPCPPGLEPLLHLGRRHILLCASPTVDTPSVLGFRRPRLLLPQHLLPSLTPADLQQILLHEREHLLRHDDWINLLQRLGLVLFPLNPALLLIDRHLGAERELACDAAVIRTTGEPFSYARCLTRLAEHRLSLRSLALSLAAWSRRSELTRRVESLLLPSTNPAAASRLPAAALVLLLAGGSAAIARAPQLISFSDPAVPTTLAAASPTLALSPGAHAVQASFHVPATTLRFLPATQHRRTRARTTITSPRALLTSAPVNPTPAPQVIPRQAVARQTIARQAVALRTAARPAATTTPRALRLTQEIPSYAAVPFAGGWLIFQL